MWVMPSVVMVYNFNRSYGSSMQEITGKLDFDFAVLVNYKIINVLDVTVK